MRATKFHCKIQLITYLKIFFQIQSIQIFLSFLILISFVYSLNKVVCYSFFIKSILDASMRSLSKVVHTNQMIDILAQVQAQETTSSMIFGSEGS